jgi:hypothetical protein
MIVAAMGRPLMIAAARAFRHPMAAIMNCQIPCIHVQYSREKRELMKENLYPINPVIGTLPLKLHWFV